MYRDLQRLLGDLHVRDDQPDALALLVGRQGLVKGTELPERRQHALLVHGVPFDLLDRPLDLLDRGLEPGAPLPELVAARSSAADGHSKRKPSVSFSVRQSLSIKAIEPFFPTAPNLCFTPSHSSFRRKIWPVKQRA